METSLRGYAIAVLQNAEADTALGGAQTVAHDLREISDVTSRNAALAQVITDEVVPAAARRAVMSDLIGGKVVAPALRIVQRAIAVEHADGLLSILLELAELATQYTDLGSQQFEIEEPLFGRLGSRRLAAGYATAVLEDVSEVSELQQIEEQLFSFANVIRENPQLSSALADSSRPLGDRRGLISEILKDRVNGVTIRLARTALGGRSRDPGGTIEWMAERTAEARGWRVARVTTARGLDQEERSELESALAQLTGQPVELLVSDDLELLGGAVISIGNLLVDGTAQHRLDQLGEQILGSDHLVASGE